MRRTKTHDGFGEARSVEPAQVLEEGKSGVKGSTAQVLGGDRAGLIIVTGERVGERQVLAHTGTAVEGLGELVQNVDRLVRIAGNHQ